MQSYSRVVGPPDSDFVLGLRAQAVLAIHSPWYTLFIQLKGTLHILGRLSLHKTFPTPSLDSWEYSDSDRKLKSRDFLSPKDFLSCISDTVFRSPYMAKTHSWGACAMKIWHTVPGGQGNWPEPSHGNLPSPAKLYTLSPSDLQVSL